MARKRQLDPEYPFEEEIARLSIPARYFYILSWCHMDDTNGVLPHDLYKLKGQIFPTDGVDIKAIVQELIDQRRLFPFEADGKRWLWCPTMLKHQSIKHPSARKYPDPPKELREGYRRATVGLPQSRVELSRVEKSSKAEPSAALKAVFDKICKDGTNIYSLLTQLKKQIDQPQDWQFPEKVLLGAFDSYEKNKTKIEAPWPYLLKCIKEESALWHANEQIKANDKRGQWAIKIGDILKK